MLDAINIIKYYRDRLIVKILRNGPFFMKRAIVHLASRPHIEKYCGSDNQGPDLFETVFFELRTRCNSHCTFCAGSVENETRPDKTMPFEVFQKGIANLKKIDFRGRVAFHITSEPLLTKNLPEFIAHAREQLPNTWLQLLSNGRKLNSRTGKSILDAGINEMTINHYNNECADNPYLSLPEGILKFESEVLYKKYSHEDVKSGHGPDPIKGFSVFRYNVIRRRETETLSNQTGSAPNKQVMSEKNYLGLCHSPLTDFHITTDGTVSKCSKDVYFSDPMGNIMDEDMLDIWNGSRFRAVHKMLLANDRTKNDMCNGCDYPGYKNLPGKSNILRKLIQEAIYSD